MSLFKWYQWLIKPFEELKNLCKRALKNGSAVDDDCRVFHFQVILKVLITMAVLSVILFDVQKYTEQASVSNFKRFMSAFYDDAYRDDIVIITFDDSDFPLVEEWDINPFAAGQPDNGLERIDSCKSTGNKEVQAICNMALGI